jgi:hypothetical protein
MPAADDNPPAKPAPRARRPRTAAALAAPSTADLPDLMTPGIEEDGAPITADRVDVRMGAVGRVDAGELSVHQGAIGGVRADRVQVERGAIGGAIAGDMQISQSFARGLVARQVHVEQSFVRSLVAAEVTTGGPTGVGILIARKVVGDVKVLLDWRGALAFGAAAGLVVGLVGRLRRRGRRGGRS